MTRLIPAPPGLLPTEEVREARRAKARRARARGKRIEDLARKAYLEGGFLVQGAPQMIHWQPMRDEQGRPTIGPRVPRSSQADLWGLWDFAAVEPVGTAHAGRVHFVQVTTLANVAAHRRLLMESDWPWGGPNLERLLAYEGRSVFRVYSPPEFTSYETWRVQTSKRRTRRVRTKDA